MLDFFAGWEPPAMVTPDPTVDDPLSYGVMDSSFAKFINQVQRERFIENMSTLGGFDEWIAVEIDRGWIDGFGGPDAQGWVSPWGELFIASDGDSRSLGYTYVWDDPAFGGWGPGNPTSPGWPGNPGWPGGDPGVGDPNRPSGWSECTDIAADRLAQDIHSAIQAQDDSNVREYGALIYRDADGTVRVTSLQAGTLTEWTPLSGNPQPSNFGLTSWTQVIGIVHSHPAFGIDGNGQLVPISPDAHWEEPNPGDWAWPDFLVGQGAGGVGGVNFRIYISHAGIIAEYDYYMNPAGGSRTVRAHDFDPNRTCG